MSAYALEGSALQTPGSFPENNGISPRAGALARLRHAVYSIIPKYYAVFVSFVILCFAILCFASEKLAMRMKMLYNRATGTVADSFVAVKTHHFILHRAIPADES